MFDFEIDICDDNSLPWMDIIPRVRNRLLWRAFFYIGKKKPIKVRIVLTKDTAMRKKSK
jgi:hypothetical protein